MVHLNHLPKNGAGLVITADSRRSQLWRVRVLNHYTCEVTKDRMVLPIDKKYLTGYSMKEAIYVYQTANVEKRDSYVGQLRLLCRLYVAIASATVIGVTGTTLKKGNDNGVYDKYFWTFVILLLTVGLSIPDVMKALFQLTSCLRM